ncbi:hypothetical protein CJF34_08510 [Pseudomonas lundensis]|nr:hypothetical protein CJF34_08510 [Pseudomonas lundensis]
MEVLRIFSKRHKLSWHVDIPQRLRIAPGGVFVSGMDFVTQMQNWSDAFTDHLASFVIGVKLLWLIKGDCAKAFCVQDQHAPNTVGPAHYYQCTAQCFMASTQPFKTSDKGCRKADFSQHSEWPDGYF